MSLLGGSPRVAAPRHTSRTRGEKTQVHSVNNVPQHAEFLVDALPCPPPPIQSSGGAHLEIMRDVATFVTFNRIRLTRSYVGSFPRTLESVDWPRVLDPALAQQSSRQGR